MHSEQLTHQDRSVRLFKARMEEGDNLLHARAHREVIRRYGRFPYRNAALARCPRRKKRSSFRAAVTRASCGTCSLPPERCGKRAFSAPKNPGLSGGFAAAKPALPKAEPCFLRNPACDLTAIARSAGICLTLNK